MRSDDREDGSVQCVGGHDASTGRRRDHPSHRGAAQQVQAHQVSDVTRTWPGGDLRQRSGLHDAPRLDDHHTIGEGICVHRVMSDQEARPIEGRQMTPEVPPHVRLGARVERREGLVEKEHTWLGREGPRQRNPLRLPARERARSQMRVVVEPNPREPGERALTGFSSRHTSSSQAERDVLDGSEAGKEQVVLEDDAHGSLVGGHEDAGDGVIEDAVVEPDQPLVDRQQAREAPKERRLPGPVRPEDGDRLATGGVELDVEVERTERALHAGVKAHGVGACPLPRKRSRRPTRTPNDTAMSTKLKTIASSGFTSFAM